MKAQGATTKVVAKNDFLQRSREVGIKRPKGFEVAVSEGLRAKYDALLQPANLLRAANITAVTEELPVGYALLVNLYKDQEFMNKVRWDGDAAINRYLYEKYPDVVQYLRANKLRISSEIVGRAREEIAIESANTKASSGSRVCYESKSEAIATAKSEATQRAGRESESRAVASFREETMACIHCESKTSGSNRFSIWSRGSLKEVALQEKTSAEVIAQTRSDVRANEDVSIDVKTRVAVREDVNANYRIDSKGQGSKTFSIWSRKPAKVTA